MMQRDRDRVYRGLVRFVKLGDVEDDHVPNRTSWYDCGAASTVQSASLQGCLCFTAAILITVVAAGMAGFVPINQNTLQ